MWYAGHAILVVRFKHPPQEYIPLWENVYLVEADSEGEAQEKIDAVAKASIIDDDHGGSFTWDERPARWEYAGIRKVIRCEMDATQLWDGQEVTYNQLSVDGEHELQQYIRGERVRIVLDS